MEYELKEFSPAKLKDSHDINLDEKLLPEERNQLLASMKEHGQIEPGVVWRGKVVDGRNRKKICRLLKLKFVARVYPDETPREKIEDVIDQGLFVGRDYTPPRRQAKLLLRFREVLEAPGNTWKTDYNGQTYRDKAVYLSKRTRIPLRTLKRDLKEIAATLGKAKPGRLLSLTGEQTRAARAIRREWKERVLDAREELREEIKKKAGRINEVAKHIRQKASEIPGGMKRILIDA